MENPIIKPRQGIILISEPSLRDFYFRQSVVLLAEHNEEGSFGIIINKPIETRLNEVLKEFTDLDIPIYLGGPVKTDSIFFIHTKENVEKSLKIIDGLYWGGDIDAIRDMMKLGMITENEITTNSIQLLSLILPKFLLSVTFSSIFLIAWSDVWLR